MKVHIVHAHPEPNSFVAAMRDIVTEELGLLGATITTTDLYGAQFNPILSERDFRERKQQDHLVYALEQRHAFTTDTLAADIQEEVENVLRADLLAFTFPVFWFSVPAILKGWIERVFISGPFYGGKRIYGRGGLAGKRAFAAMSLGGRAHMFGANGIHGELETGMMRHFFQGTLGYVGLAVHRPFVAYHVPYVDEAARKLMLGSLRSYVRNLDDQPMIRMPTFDPYDHVFMPRAGAPGYRGK